MLFRLERAKAGPGGLPVRPGCADPVLHDTEPNYVFRRVRRRENQRGSRRGGWAESGPGVPRPHGRAGGKCSF